MDSGGCLQRALQLGVPASAPDTVLLGDLFLSKTFNGLRRPFGHWRRHDVPLMELPGLNRVPEQL